MYPIALNGSNIPILFYSGERERFLRDFFGGFCYQFLGFWSARGFRHEEDGRDDAVIGFRSGVPVLGKVPFERLIASIDLGRPLESRSI